MLSFEDATANIYNRIGRLGKIISQMDTYQASQLYNMTNLPYGTTFQFSSESDIQAEIGNSYMGQLNAVSSIGGLCQQIAVDTFNRMVFRDNPRINQTLTSQNTLASIQEVIRQMGILGATIKACVVTATNSSFTGVGNGVINASVRRPLDARVLENSLAEKLLLTCQSDSYSGSATAGNESFTVTGVGNSSSPFNFDWPLGSNAQNSLSAIDGDSDNTSGNLLTNSGFENWTANIPNNFTLAVGVAGTNIAKETTIVYDPVGNGESCRLTGDGSSTLTEIRQLFDDTTGTTGTLTVSTQYSFCLFMCRGGSTVSSGVLEVSLVDAGLNVIQDNSGANNLFTFDLTTLNTTFASFTGVFRTPFNLPATQYLRVRLSTALPNNISVYLDKMSLGLMTQIYTSGPFLAVHAGSIPFAINDYGTTIITNDRGGSGTLDSFQVLLVRLMPDTIIPNEIIFPSSSTPTIKDTLITS